MATDPLWLELEEKPPDVTQAMLQEWAKHRERVEDLEHELWLARADRDAVAYEIEGMLILGAGCESGKYVASVDAGVLEIGREEEVRQGKELPPPPPVVRQTAAQRRFIKDTLESLEAVYKSMAGVLELFPINPTGQAFGARKVRTAREALWRAVFMTGCAKEK